MAILFKKQSAHALIFFGFLGSVSYSAEAREMSSIDKNAVGVLEMSTDGTLTLEMFEAPQGANTQTIKPTDRYYERHIQEVGGIHPGERKFIYRSAGEVTMSDDGSIRYIMNAFSESGEAFGTSGIAKPGDPNYEDLLKRVGGLKPGQTKPLPYK